MTAKISPTTNKGTTMPVDSFALKAKAIKVTFTTAIPLIPALDNPITMAAVKARTQAVVVISEASNSVTEKVYQSENKSILIYFIFSS